MEIPIKLEDDSGSTSYFLTVQFTIEKILYDPILEETEDTTGDSEDQDDENSEEETGDASSGGAIQNQSKKKQFGGLVVGGFKPDFEDEEEEIEEKEIILPPKIKIQSIDNFGQVIMSFSEELKVSLMTKERVEKELLNLFEFVILGTPGLSDDEQRRLQVEEDEAEPVEKDKKEISKIEVERLDKGALIFNLRFLNPFAITPPGSSDKDILLISFKNNTIVLDDGTITTTL